MLGVIVALHLTTVISIYKKNFFSFVKVSNTRKEQNDWEERILVKWQLKVKFRPNVSHTLQLFNKNNFQILCSFCKYGHQWYPRDTIVNLNEKKIKKRRIKENIS